LYITAGIKGILKRYNVDVDKAYQNIDNFASIMGFEFTRKQIEKNAPQTRAAFVDMEKFIRMLDRKEFQEINEKEEEQTTMA